MLSGRNFSSESNSNLTLWLNLSVFDIRVLSVLCPDWISFLARRLFFIDSKFYGKKLCLRIWVSESNQQIANRLCVVPGFVAKTVHSLLLCFKLVGSVFKFWISDKPINLRSLKKDNFQLLYSQIWKNLIQLKQPTPLSRNLVNYLTKLSLVCIAENNMLFSHQKNIDDDPCSARHQFPLRWFFLCASWTVSLLFHMHKKAWHRMDPECCPNKNFTIFRPT